MPWGLPRIIDSPSLSTNHILVTLGYRVTQMWVTSKSHLSYPPIQLSWKVPHMSPWAAWEWHSSGFTSGLPSDPIPRIKSQVPLPLRLPYDSTPGLSWGYRVTQVCRVRITLGWPADVLRVKVPYISAWTPWDRWEDSGVTFTFGLPCDACLETLKSYSHI